MPNEAELEAPNPGVLLAPKAGVPEDPKPLEPNAGALVAPNNDGDVEPNAGVVVPNAGVVVAPNAVVVVAPKAGVLDAPKVLLPNAGCVCWNVPPKALDWLGEEPKPPKLGFCPNNDDPLPKVDDVAPNAGAGDAPKVGAELPNGEDDGVPNAGVDGWPKAPADVAPNAGVDGWPKAPVDVEPNAGVDGWPKAPVDVVPKGEPPVCAPNVVVGLPNGFGANGLEVEVLAWPNPVWAPKGLLEVWPKGLVDDCPNAARNKHIISH